MESNEKPLPTADKIIEDLGIVAAGHRLPDGNLNPKLEDNEIRNKLWSITSGLRVLEDEGRVEEAVNTLKTRFPDKIGYMKDIMKKLKVFKRYLNLFGE